MIQKRYIGFLLAFLPCWLFAQLIEPVDNAVEFVTLEEAKTEGTYEARQSIKLVGKFSAEKPFVAKINPEAINYYGYYEFEIHENICEHHYGLSDEIIESDIGYLQFPNGYLPKMGLWYHSLYAKLNFFSSDVFFENRDIKIIDSVDRSEIVPFGPANPTLIMLGIDGSSYYNENGDNLCSEYPNQTPKLENYFLEPIIVGIRDNTCNQVVETLEESQVISDQELTDISFCPSYDVAGNQTGYGICVEEAPLEEQIPLFEEDSPLAEKIVIYPSPTNGPVTISWDQSLDNLITGIQVVSPTNTSFTYNIPYTVGMQSAETDLTAYPAGVYYFQFSLNVEPFTLSKGVNKN